MEEGGDFVNLLRLYFLYEHKVIYIGNLELGSFGIDSSDLDLSAIVKIYSIQKRICSQLRRITRTYLDIN